MNTGPVTLTIFIFFCRECGRPAPLDVQVGPTIVPVCPRCLAVLTAHARKILKEDPEHISVEEHLENIVHMVREAGRGDRPEQIRNEFWMKTLTRAEAALGLAPGGA